MGVGKSTIGRLLAKKLRFKFIDVDRLIERQEKRSIKKIFDVDGEEYFRKIEEKVTLKILKNKSSIIALGGGAFINNEIRKEIIKNCCSIWLNLSLELLIKRYKRNNKRPLLEGNNLESEVKKILQSRKKIYALANFKINCDNMNKKDVVQKILDLYAKN
tara:strand:- start:120 stop:599 length:480 start_codon:yes stop_codon:yes gene_type:complete